jgi:hypothetical protein
MKRKPKKCPVCRKNDEVIPIAYGYPGEEMIEDFEAGRIKLGGCVIEPDQPRWYCKRDQKPF